MTGYVQNTLAPYCQRFSGLNAAEENCIDVLASKFIEATVARHGTDEDKIQDLFISLHQLALGFEEPKLQSEEIIARRWMDVRSAFSQSVYKYVVNRRYIDSDVKYTPYKHITLNEQNSLVGTILQNEMDSPFSQLDFLINRSLWQSTNAAVLNLGLDVTDTFYWGILDFVGEHPITVTISVGGALFVSPFLGSISAFMASLGIKTSSMISVVGAVGIFGVVSHASMQIGESHLAIDQLEVCKNELAQVNLQQNNDSCLEEDTGLATVFENFDPMLCGVDDTDMLSSKK